jgi:hypothetical protein
LKTVKQTLSRAEQRRIFHFLQSQGFTPQMTYSPSLSGHTMTIFLVKVPEEQHDAARELLWKRSS